MCLAATTPFPLPGTSLISNQGPAGKESAIIVDVWEGTSSKFASLPETLTVVELVVFVFDSEAHHLSKGVLNYNRSA